MWSSLLYKRFFRFPESAKKHQDAANRYLDIYWYIRKYVSAPHVGEERERFETFLENVALRMQYAEEEFEGVKKEPPSVVDNF